MTTNAPPPYRSAPFPCMQGTTNMTIRLLHRLLLLLLLFLLLVYPVASWRQWNYTSSTTDDWHDLFGPSVGPGGRRGHTLVLFNRSKVILFGGRDNDVHRPHVPKTYEIRDTEGRLDFVSYDEKPLSPRHDPETCQVETTCSPLTNASTGNNVTCSYSWVGAMQQKGAQDHRRKTEEVCGFVPAALFYNDVWIYDVDCGGDENHNCMNERGWRVLHSGAKLGGCRTEADAKRVCDAPSERWGHGSAMLDHTTMMIYGGFSHECEDYCDDLWLFDLSTLEWRRALDSESSSSSLRATSGPADDDGPGPRWKFSMNGGAIDATTGESMVVLFGGHRLWHGFASDNAEANDWKSRELMPTGGYMNDLWIYAKQPANESSVRNSSNATEYMWERCVGKETCKASPGASWESRNDIVCTIHWPMGRSGHTTVVDNERQGLWLFGGYTAPYPYPTSTSPGSGWGIDSGGDGAGGGSSSDGGFVPSGFSFFLDDLWFYNFTSEYWEEKIPVSMRNPERRTEHVMALSDNILILYGGYSHNRYFNDTWFYYIDENRWLLKTEFVNADYPLECKDEMEHIKSNPDCIELTYPPDLIRSNQTTRAIKYKEILPFRDQPGYTPDPSQPLYFGIVDDADIFVEGLRRTYLDQELFDEDGNIIWIESNVPDGTPIAPAAATGPRQYAKQRHIRYNETTVLDVWEWCVSGRGEPTRKKLLDGRHGRANNPVSIPQPRRQAPGWDGCRELHWKHPQSRSDLASVFIGDPHYALFFFGGVGYANEPHGPCLDNTHETLVLDDLWTFSVFDCPSNCSDHGVCTNGFCQCDLGYWGNDCSNFTCPGTVCHYDEDNVQHCTHCCHDGYVHTDEDEYIAGIRKMPCRVKDDGYDAVSFTGQSEGICDGFGTCQCAPPFLGDDCSIKDCKHNCSFNGYCSLEYPVSRCICREGYFGEFCQNIACLNNCSYPNGLCDFNTGSCTCSYIADPLNKSRIWGRFHGEDCSYLPVWSGCSGRLAGVVFSFASLVACVVLSVAALV